VAVSPSLASHDPIVTAVAETAKTLPPVPNAWAAPGRLMETNSSSAYDTAVRSTRYFMSDGRLYTTQIDISAAGAAAAQPTALTGDSGETTRLLRDMVVLQHKTCELLTELLNQVSQQQRQRNAELKAWREANPELAVSCRHAAESLAKVHTEFLANVAREAFDNAEDYVDSEYALGEFIDRYGPRLAHFNGVLQLFGQLAAPPQQPGTTAEG
jgi:hypothetical protein